MLKSGRYRFLWRGFNNIITNINIDVLESQVPFEIRQHPLSVETDDAISLLKAGVLGEANSTFRVFSSQFNVLPSLLHTNQ